MAKSRYHKKSRSNRRKTQRKMSQRGGGWPFDGLFGTPDPKAAEAKAAADKAKVDAAAKLKAEEAAKVAADKAASANTTTTTTPNPADPSTAKPWYMFGGGRRGRKSSRRSNLKRKL